MFQEATGTLEVAQEGTFEVDAHVRAESFNSKNEDRDAHVRGEDFLNAEQYPELTFVTKGIRPAYDTFDMTGDLTIRGVSREVTFEVEFGGQAVDPFGATRAGFSASAVISRNDFGLNWNAALEAAAFWSATRSPSTSRSPSSTRADSYPFPR